MHGLIRADGMTLRKLAIVGGALLLVSAQVRAQAPGLGASAELVDTKSFRVCADPRDLPFSDEAGPEN